MAKINRYDGNLQAFAISASPTYRYIFGEETESDDITANITSKFFAGWEQGLSPFDNKPPIQYFNAVSFVNSQILSYIHQVGVVEWNALQEYDTGSFCNYNGNLYVSLVDNNIGNNPNTATVQWKLSVIKGLNYSATYSYSIGDFITYNNIIYYSLVNSNVGNTPLTSPTEWNSIFNNAALTGDPTAPTQAPNDNSTKIATTAYVDAAVALAVGWQTGDIKKTLNATPLAGWFAWVDGTIGSSTSGATVRANNDTQALFTLIWNGTSNANCAVSGGRGASALDDWTANKTIALPQTNGRALVNLGAGTYNLADFFGVNSNTLSEAQLPSVTVTLNDPGHPHTIDPIGTSGGSSGGQVGNGNSGDKGTQNTLPAFTGITANPFGSGTPVENRMPGVAVYFNIKL